MAIGAIPGVGAGVSQLAALYRQQVVSGAGSAGSASTVTAGSAAGTVAQQAQAARGADFASVLGNGLQNLESLDQTASSKAVQAATGDLQDVHDYVIAASQAQLATELTTTVRNKALESFNEIMRMQL